MPVLTKINSNVIADDAITGDMLGASAYLANTASQNISGTYSENRLYTSDAYTLSGNATVNSNLTLSTVKSSGDVVLTAGGAYTITGTGVLSGGSVVAKANTDLTGMTGTIGSGVTLESATFPAGHIVGVHHSGLNNANVNNAGDVVNSKTVNFNRVLSNSNFIVTVMCNRYRGSSSGRLRIGYTRGVGSLSTSYLGQADNTGEEDGSNWHNVSITYKDETTGSAGDSMYFGTFFSNTSATCSTRGAAIMVMEIVVA
tara:strand:+ start:65 stop:835 length:771 start_codon:yes stop_codon:yes gene_type:complete